MTINTCEHNFHAISGPNGMCECGVKADGTVVTCHDLLEAYVQKRLRSEALIAALAVPREPDPPELREQLAALAHDQWSGWMRHLFSKGKSTPTLGGMAVRLPAEWAERWMRQMNTPYAELTDAEKESDRLEADRVLDLVSLLAVPPPPKEADPALLSALTFIETDLPQWRHREAVADCYHCNMAYIVKWARKQLAVRAVPPPQEAPQQEHEDQPSRVDPLSLKSEDGIYRDQPKAVVTAATRPE